jgi:BTB/POZ domain
MTPDTRQDAVRFNVGGTLFETSRTLFTFGTMASSTLGQMVNENVPGQVIFIDRDGEIFRHVLPFLRYGRVSLPLMINKAAFLRDLEFYGVAVPINDDGTIMEDAIDESNANLQAAHRIIALDRECERRANELKDEREHILVAHACFKEYMRTGSLLVTIKDPDLVCLAKSVCHQRDMECFNKYLSKYGLRNVKAANTYSDRTGEYSFISFMLEIATVAFTYHTFGYCRFCWRRRIEFVLYIGQLATLLSTRTHSSLLFA